jgi:autotransporter translocation and assembly factor TamB
VGPLSGTVVLDGQEARFARLVLSSKRGAADLAGRVHWEASGIDDVLLRATFSDYRFDQLGLLQTTVNGSVTASGALEALHIEGTLALDGIRISFPSEEDPVLKEIRVYNLPEGEDGTSIREGGEIAGVEEQSTVDVTFALPPGTWVRGIGLDAEIIGSVHVTKAAGEPLQYGGRLEVEHGRYTLQGKRFELDRGVAVFTGGPSAIPDVDIQAHRKASREVTVYAHVTGPANKPNLQLTSDPPMDTAEIISYMFFGRSTTAGDRESRGLGVSAASVAGSLLLDSVAPELRDTLRIDEISVTSDEDGTPAVEVETQVTPDVYLRLVQSLGASADEAVEVRWRFWRDFNLKSRVSRSGISAIDLLWVFDYWGLAGYGLEGLRSPPAPYRAESQAPADCRPPLVCPPP